MYSIALHGGAGTILKSAMTEEKESEYKTGLLAAIDKGIVKLKAGESALDAVVSVVMELENNPLFNAGRGSVFTNAGLHEMDAAIMDGRNKSCGAVAGIKNVKNPVLLSKMVMERSEFVFLSGTGAEAFARKHQLDFEDDAYFFNQFRFDQWNEIKNTTATQMDHSDKKFGTVGCVAMDRHGNLAAATSTGGMTNKQFGRIGDSPIIGSGTWADNTTCAISCTGHGEYFIKNVVAYDVACLMEYKNLSLKKAVQIVVMEKLVKMGGEGGLIAIDNKGQIEMVFNTEGMYRAFAHENTSPSALIYR